MRLASESWVLQSCQECIIPGLTAQTPAVFQCCELDQISSNFLFPSTYFRELTGMLVKASLLFPSSRNSPSAKMVAQSCPLNSNSSAAYLNGSSMAEAALAHQREHQIVSVTVPPPPQPQYHPALTLHHPGKRHQCCSWWIHRFVFPY